MVLSNKEYREFTKEIGCCSYNDNRLTSGEKRRLSRMVRKFHRGFDLGDILDTTLVLSLSAFGTYVLILEPLIKYFSK